MHEHCHFHCEQCGEVFDIGFSVEDCRLLLSLYHDRDRDSADVKAIAEAKVADIDRKIAALEGLRHMLHHLVEHCQGDERPDCPIINELAGKGLVQ